MSRLWAVRGATTVVRDEPGLIVAATRELLSELFAVNQIGPEQIVSIIFTVTPDISSEFPAVAAREMGLADTPLICAQEIPKNQALPLCIRVMMHFYTDLAKDEIRAAYLHNAVKLRPDLVRVNEERSE